MKKINISIIVSALALIWIIASYINTVSCIDSQTYNYAWWNVIEIIFGGLI